MGKRKTATTFARREKGFYPTPREAFAPLVPFLPKWGVYVDPCAGDGALVDHMRAEGLAVLGAWDIAPQASFVYAKDALALTAEDVGDCAVITNPPWPEPRRNGEPTLSIIEHLLTVVPMGWFLLPADFMHNIYAAPLMRQCSQIVSIGRVTWIPGSGTSGLENCCWYQFYNFSTRGRLTFTPNAPKVTADVLKQASERLGVHLPSPPRDGDRQPPRSSEALPRAPSPGRS